MTESVRRVESDRTSQRRHRFAMIAGFAIGGVFAYPAIKSPDLAAPMMLLGIAGSFLMAAVPTLHWIKSLAMTQMLTIGFGPFLFFAYRWLFHLLGIL